MKIIRLSIKSQGTIPRAIQQAHEISLRPQEFFPQTCLGDVAGCLPYNGQSKTLEDMNDAIRQGILKSLRNYH